MKNKPMSNTEDYKGALILNDIFEAWLYIMSTKTKKGSLSSIFSRNMEFKSFPQNFPASLYQREKRKLRRKFPQRTNGKMKPYRDHTNTFLRMKNEDIVSMYDMATSALQRMSAEENLFGIFSEKLNISVAIFWFWKSD